MKENPQKVWGNKIIIVFLQQQFPPRFNLSTKLQCGTYAIHI